jgi:hypothetical protein
MMSVEGVDYMYAVPSNTVSCFAQNGIKFICRYYATSNNTKNLTQSEAKTISSNGIDIVTVYETNPTYASYFTYNQGYNDCLDAVSRAGEVGQPYNSAIYFAVDYDASNDLPNINNYFHGVGDAMQQYAKMNGGSKWYIGVYGGYAVVNYIKGKWGVSYVWQTSSWSNGNIYPGYNIYQYEISTKSNPVKLCNVEVDKDRSPGNYGGFRI